MKSYMIDTTAMENNLRILRKTADKAVIWGVIKGNGYGLGCERMAGLLSAQGIDHFAVTDIREVQALRQSGYSENPILMLKNLQDCTQLSALLDLDCILTIGTREDARRLNALGLERASPVRVHLKIDTGMGRYGFLPEQTNEILRLYAYYPGITFTGIYTHFSNASDASVTERQFLKFQSVVTAISRAGFDPGMVHCCNSTAFWKYPHMRLDAVRLGSCLLGRVPWADQAGLQRIGICQAALEEIRCIPAGHTIGYNSGWKARRNTRIAILGIGYFHGFSLERGFDLWRFSDCLRGIARYIKAFFCQKALYVQINGQPCRVLGHVGMVNMVIDVTDCQCQVGDIALVDINPLLVKGLDVVCQ